ncbi:MAG: CbiQ family ECF transporter T component [Geitlerinemataceae cyanobacterium]
MDLLRSLPLGLYLEQPVTWLHHLDPRVKLAWLMSFLLWPVLASPLCRAVLVGVLILLTLAARIPRRVWKQQLGLPLFFCVLILAISAIAPDGIGGEHQPRFPKDELSFAQQAPPPPAAPTRNPWSDPLGWWNDRTSATPETTAPELPQPTSYRYVLFEQGPVKITRHSLELGIRVSTLFFTLVYSTNLYLLTTAPEAITAGLEDLMQPLRWFKLPITEIALTLTLSLRFIPLVMEEIQNLSRSVQTRAINWKKLGFRGSLKLWSVVVERLLENLLLRAEQIACAMQVRGFTTPDTHRVEWHQLRLHHGDTIALVLLLGGWVARAIWGWQT